MFKLGGRAPVWVIFVEEVDTEDDAPSTWIWKLIRKISEDCLQPLSVHMMITVGSWMEEEMRWSHIRQCQRETWELQCGARGLRWRYDKLMAPDLLLREDYEPERSAKLCRDKSDWDMTRLWEDLFIVRHVLRHRRDGGRFPSPEVSWATACSLLGHCKL